MGGVLFAFRRDMQGFGLWGVLMLAGALGLLVFGMKLMSASLQQVAGPRLRKGVDALTEGRSRGVFTGFALTAVMQYSSVVAVMVVSFVNSGILSLRRAIPVLIGANIGTTLKLLLFAAIGFSAWQLSSVALPMLALALPLLLARSPRLKTASNLLVGMALLFLAIGLIRDHVPPPSAATMGFLHTLQGMGPLSVILFVAIGALLAITVQSSSVALVLTLALCEAGTINYASGAALVLGENIGTTFTAIIAAQAGNAWAKRAARAHLLIKLLGVAGALVLFKPLLAGIAAATEWINGADPHADISVLKWSLAYLHFAFNVVNGIILLQCVPWLERMVTRWVPAHTAPEAQHRLTYMEDPMMVLTPELSLLEAQNEAVNQAKRCERMIGMLRKLLLTADKEIQATQLQRLAKYAQISERVELELGSFLARAGSEARGEAMNLRMHALRSVALDLDRTAALLLHMGRTLERRSAAGHWFDPGQRQDLLTLFDLLEQAMRVAVGNLEEAETCDHAAAEKAGQALRRHCANARNAPVPTPEAGPQAVHAGPVHAALLGYGEEVGGHLLRISGALAAAH